MPDISPAKMGLFGIIRELRFRVCTHGEHVQVPPRQGKGPFKAGKRKLAGLCSAKSLWLFLAESLLVTKNLSTSYWVHAQLLICVRLFVTPWTVAGQAPLSMGFSRQEYWSGLPCPPPEDLPNPGIKLRSPAFAIWATRGFCWAKFWNSSGQGTPFYVCSIFFLLE